jgi:hypothetical protein
MGVHPSGERTLDLLVPELLSLHAVAVDRNPVHADRTEAQPKDHAGARLDPSGSPLDGDPLPRGREALPGARERVTPEGRVNGCRNPNALHEGVRGHQLPGADQQP